MARVDAQDLGSKRSSTNGNQELLMYFRTSTGVAWQSRSAGAADQTAAEWTAADWTKPGTTKALNPDSKGQLLRLEPDGPLAYAGNRHRVRGSV